MGISMKFFLMSCLVGLAVAMLSYFSNSVLHANTIRICPSEYGPIIILKLSSGSTTLIRHQESHETLECIGRSTNIFNKKITLEQNINPQSKLFQDLSKHYTIVSSLQSAKDTSSRFEIVGGAAYIRSTNELVIIQFNKSLFPHTDAELTAFSYDKITVVGFGEMSNVRSYVIGSRQVTVKRIRLKDTGVIFDL